MIQKIYSLYDRFGRKSTIFASILERKKVSLRNTCTSNEKNVSPPARKKKENVRIKTSSTVFTK